MKAMPIKKAQTILRQHNAWRRGNSDVQQCPAEIGLALDALLIRQEIKTMTDAELRLARSRAESKLAPLITESNRRAKLVNAAKKLSRELRKSS